MKIHWLLKSFKIWSKKRNDSFNIAIVGSRNFRAGLNQPKRETSQKKES